MLYVHSYTDKEGGEFKDMPHPFNSAPDHFWARVAKLRGAKTVTIYFESKCLEIHSIAFTPPQAGIYIRWDCINGFDNGNNTIIARLENVIESLESELSLLKASPLNKEE